MIPYISYREKKPDGTLGYFIAQKLFPHYVGEIVTSQIQGAIVNAPIAGYNLWITFAGTLRGNMIPNFKDIIKEIENNYFEMAQWYYENRIVVDSSRFKKFKINANTVNQ